MEAVLVDCPAGTLQRKGTLTWGAIAKARRHLQHLDLGGGSKSQASLAERRIPMPREQHSDASASRVSELAGRGFMDARRIMPCCWIQACGREKRTF